MLANNHLANFMQWCNTNCTNPEIVFTRLHGVVAS